MFLAGDIVMRRRRGLSRVDVEAVLALLREVDHERDNEVVRYRVAHIFGQALLLDAVLV